MHNIHPIRNREDLDNALDQVEDLMDLNPEHGTAEADRLEVLSVLVRAYEDEHHPIPPPSPLVALQFAIDQQMLTRKELELVLGSAARVTEILNGSRGLSIGMIRRLNAAYPVSFPLNCLVQPAPPELWLDLTGPGRANAKSALTVVKRALEALTESGEVKVRSVALDTTTTRVALEGAVQVLEKANTLLAAELGPQAIRATRRVSWPATALIAG